MSITVKRQSRSQRQAVTRSTAQVIQFPTSRIYRIRTAQGMEHGPAHPRFSFRKWFKE